MRILVVGSGGREHALVWKLRKSPRVREVFCAPGNGGIARDAVCVPVSAGDRKAFLDLARREKIDLVIIGPEAPLAEGMADLFRQQGVPVLGPGRAAARLESSKVFAKEFMVRHRVPTGAFTVHDRAEEALARAGSSEVRYPLVVKADGLAAGKGVVVAANEAEAGDAIRRIMVEREFGSAGDRTILEECLFGTEASFIVFTDGETILPAVAAQDHKAAFDNDQGPNTGGMGAYSNDQILDTDLQQEVLDRIIRPVVTGLKEEGCPFQGILYAGLMLTADGPQVLEFNVRMGDPEGQVIMPRMASDFAALCEAVCAGRLKEYKAEWSRNASVCVVLASGGYPGPYENGKTISGLEMAEEDARITVFHSGTVREGAGIKTQGGRVLGVTASAAGLADAVIAAYEAVNKIYFEGMHYRRDIGAKGLKGAM